VSLAQINAEIMRLGGCRAQLGDAQNLG
jgi:hypothetical protein